MTLSGAVFQQTSTAITQRRRNVHSAQLKPGRYPQSDSHIEPIPLHSQLLRESSLVSFPPLINMLKSSGSSYPNEVMHCSTRLRDLVTRAQVAVGRHTHRKVSALKH